MEKLKKALVLFSICAVCAVLIAITNLVTSSAIENNNKKREQQTLNDIYNSALFEEIEFDNNSISNVWRATRSSEVVGYVYSISGSNDYGDVGVMFGINLDGSIINVKLIKNSESYATKLKKHIKNAYANPIYDLDSVDLKCGATFAATLVKDLINIGLNDFYERVRYE